MKLAENPFTQALKSGKKQIGLWLSLSSGYAAEVVATSGYDWVLLDTEHSPSDLSTVLAQLQVYAASTTTAIVRPDWNDPVKVKRLLDIGAPGLLFPFVQNVDEAKAAVAATRYPPRGIRGVSTATRANAFGRISNYLQEVENQTAVIVQLETRHAIEHAEEISAVDGVTGVFFGPADIAADIGLLGKAADPAVWELIDTAAQKLIAKGIPVGTLVFDPQFATKLLNDGFTFVACGSDLSLLAKGADALLARMRDGSGH